jgi:hypothetical protein
MMKPRPIEGPMQPPSAPPQMADDAGYTGSDQRCANCAHFDGMEKCAVGVNGGTCEPMGHCDKFEGGESEEQEAMPEAAEGQEQG